MTHGQFIQLTGGSFVLGIIACFLFNLVRAELRDPTPTLVSLSSRLGRLEQAFENAEEKRAVDRRDIEALRAQLLPSRAQ